MSTTPSMVQNCATRRKRILVVDDEREVRTAIEIILRKEGFDVESAAGVDEAVELARRGPLDLVITDLVMPGADGLALLAKIRAIRPEAKVIVMTAYGEWGSYIEAMSGGASEYVGKPLKKDAIVRLARKALGLA